MSNKNIQNASIILLIIGSIISIYFLISTRLDWYNIWDRKVTNYAVTGQVGDFLGGVVGTIFSLVGTLLIYISFKEQTKQYLIDGFEKTFFELMHFHRENVNQMNYTKFDGVELSKSEHKKVFRIIFREFLECYEEVKKFSDSKNVEDYILKKYTVKLETIIKSNNIKVDIIEMALIDIAYSIVFFGVGEEGEIILNDRFKTKYNQNYFESLLQYIKLKPKQENTKRWKIWKNLNKQDYKDFKQITQEFYNHCKNISTNIISDEAEKLISKNNFYKYYGGHQHRLGHYFRHLFQCYKYLHFHEGLKKEQKEFYSNIFKAQLSNYEQCLIFVNSVSTLGMRWELEPNFKLLKKGESVDNLKLITNYGLIRNILSHQILGIVYKSYYPNVKYETEE